MTDLLKLFDITVVTSAGVDIRGTHYRIQQGDLDGAARLYMQAQPFPAITGRVCFHPCESSCARAAVDAPVNINGVEQVLGDWAAEMPAEEAKHAVTLRKWPLSVPALRGCPVRGSLRSWAIR